MIDDPLVSARLREAPPPPVALVRRRLAHRRGRRRALRLGALTAVAGAVWLLVPGVRDRGIADLPLVSLDAVAEGPAGARPLADGAVVRADERVVFFVRTTLGGEVSLREVDGSGAVPVIDGTWTVSAGESAPGGDRPLSWRPDRPLDRARYELSVCAGPERCGTDVLLLRWAP